MDFDYTGLLHSLDALKIEYTVGCPLALHTSFRIGGPADVTVMPKNCDEVLSALTAVRKNKIRHYVIGNGTNVLFSDEGFRGAVIVLSGANRFYGVTQSDGEFEVITADAGFPLTRLAAEAAKLSLAGLEFAYGIPGTVGGGIFMNAGAYGGEISKVVHTSRWYDVKSGEVGSRSADEHDFSYRHSSYMDDGKIILAADFRIIRGNSAEIYAKMNDFMSRRTEKQPLDMPSAGSVFKRGNGFITAQLIEECGLKGERVGGAVVSEKHAGFIVNAGGATCKDVLALIGIIKNTVFEKSGKTIECEVRYISRD